MSLLAFGQTGGTTSAPAPAQNQTFHYPPSYPPTADADPSVRHEVVLSIPTRLSIKRTSDRISFGFDPASSQNVKITVGLKMTMGVKYEMRVYAKGDPRPLNACKIGYTSINEPVNGTAHVALTGRAFLNTGQGGIPAPGKRYNIEESVSIFETDKPAGHLWSPAEQTAAINAVREYALSYTKSLSNYTGTLTIRHTTRPPNAVNDWSIESTTTTEQVTLVDRKEIADPLLGTLLRQSGDLLRIIFEPETAADLHWRRAASLNGHKMDVFAFRVPQSSGFIVSDSGAACRRLSRDSSLPMLKPTRSCESR